MAEPITEQTNFVIPKVLNNLFYELHLSPENILQEYALSKIHSKIDKYKSEDNFYRSKYSCTYSDFKAKVNKMQNAENFQFDDDLMDWQFSVENIDFWQNKLKVIKI